MAAPTFDSVAKAATQSNATVSQYVRAYSLWVKLGPTEGAKANGNMKNVLGFLTDVKKGAKLHYEALMKSMNV